MLTKSEKIVKLIFFFFLQIEDEGDDFRIDGDTGLDCKIKRCEWTLPKRSRPCIIDASIGYNDELRDCYGSDIKFVGSSSCSSSVQDDCIGTCDIEVQNADSSYEGMWILKAVLQTGTGSSYTDNINVTFEGRIIGNLVNTRCINKFWIEPFF